MSFIFTRRFLLRPHCAVPLSKHETRRRSGELRRDFRQLSGRKLSRLLGDRGCQKKELLIALRLRLSRVLRRVDCFPYLPVVDPRLALADFPFLVPPAGLGRRPHWLPPCSVIRAITRRTLGQASRQNIRFGQGSGATIISG